MHAVLRCFLALCVFVGFMWSSPASAAPTWATDPSISPTTLTVGDLATCASGTATGVGTISYEYKWRYDDGGGFADLNSFGASNDTYTVASPMEKTDVLRCVVRATDSVSYTHLTLPTICSV